MTPRIATVAASLLALGLALPAGSALAQARGLTAAPDPTAYIYAYDDDIDTADSIAPRRPDLSAEAGSAARPERAGPDLGSDLARSGD